MQFRANQDNPDKGEKRATVDGPGLELPWPTLAKRRRILYVVKSPRLATVRSADLSCHAACCPASQTCTLLRLIVSRINKRSASKCATAKKSHEMLHSYNPAPATLPFTLHQVHCQRLSRHTPPHTTARTVRQDARERKKDTGTR